MTIKTLQDLLALDRDDMAAEIEEIISESFDVDWTALDGARRVTDFLRGLAGIKDPDLPLGKR